MNKTSNKIDKPTRILLWAITYRCPLRCKYCYLQNLDRLKRGLREVEDSCIWKFAEAIGRNQAGTFEKIWLTGGEPTVHPQVMKLTQHFIDRGIKTIITTCAVMPKQKLDELLSVCPSGITVSLDSHVQPYNDFYRGHTRTVVRSLKYIAENKAESTLLGVTAVVTSENVHHIYDLAVFLSRLGVDYMSVNPLHVADKTSALNHLRLNQKSGELLLSQLRKIQDHHIIRHQSLAYLDILANWLLGQPLSEDYRCPAGTTFVFVDPYGTIYPCSSEHWQVSPYSSLPNICKEVIADASSKVRQIIGAEPLSTSSSCFSSRCISCWKLYYNDIF